MKIVVLGTGYVGLVTGSCLADSGNDVTCVDIDAAKIERLQRGEIPIYEPGLDDIVVQNVRAGRLRFTTDAATAVPAAQITFVAVGTPQNETGAADLTGLWKAIDGLATLVAPGGIVVIKSTVPVGTNRVAAERLRKLAGRTIDVASNPEFLKEGCAIDDFTKPDRVVVGVARPEVAEILHELHKPFLRTEKPFLAMDYESAEMTKYVANCLLATKISFINEMANLCERVGADVNAVRRGIGHDARIGFSFLFPGAGYGGSCFPKDVRALIQVAEKSGLTPRILHSVDAVNNEQKQILFRKVQTHLGPDLAGRKVAVWGLAFKPRTDDVREAPALDLLRSLTAAGSLVQVHDPIAMPNVRRMFGDTIAYFENQYDCLDGAEALVIVTEWNEFRAPDFAQIRRRLKTPVIIDGRNLYSPQMVATQGFLYDGIGLPRVVPLPKQD